jgi:hypothetical protein
MPCLPSAPSLQPSSSPHGHYPITATGGTLAAHNYSFSVVTGILTILP